MTELTNEQIFLIAVRKHQAGHLRQAERLYRQILAGEPNHTAASHNLGVLAQQVGQNDAALELIRHAIAVRPDWSEAYCSLGEVLRARGQLDDAVAALRQAVTLQPGNATAHYNLGNILKDKGQLDEAIASFRRAIALKPDYLKAHGNLGSALQEKGQLEEAIASYRQVTALMPGSPEAHSNLGGALRDQGRLDEAIAAFRRAVALDPNSAPAHNNLGVALKADGQLDEGIASFRQALALQPGMHQAHGNLGNALREKGQLDEAIASSRQAVALEPNYSEAHYNLGAAFWDKGQPDEAITACRRAISLKPDLFEARRNLAFSLLLRGDFAQGWEEYEWRWKARDFPSPPRDFAQPLWDGRPLHGATLLLHAEQGLGDTIQFVRYLPLAAQRGGKIILECPAELQRLLKPLAGEFPVVTQGRPLPPFDVHCPLLSLPRVFGTTLENIPAKVPYLRADPQAAGKWRERMAADAGSFKVGLAWAGSQMNRNDRNRSMPRSALAPLRQLQGVSFYSLQKEVPQLRDMPEELELIDWTEELKDFADTAALIANLDLVVSVDTAVAHLAGAMGKRVGVLLPFVPDWRWLLTRKDSPWYPTARLFRQPRAGDWDSVTRQLTQVLRAMRDKRMQLDVTNR